MVKWQTWWYVSTEVRASAGLRWWSRLQQAYAWLKLCAYTTETQENPHYSLKTMRLWAYAEEVWKYSAKEDSKSWKRLFEEDSKRPEIWMCYPIHTNIHLAEDESLNQGDWPQRLSNHWLPRSYADTGVTPRKPGLKIKELKTTTTTEKTHPQPHTTGDIISQT